MSREKYKTRKSRILKGITISFAVLLSVGLVFALVYARFGIAGFSRILGLDKQQNITTGTVEKTEIGYIEEKLGYDPGNTEKTALHNTGHIEMSLSPEGLDYLISSMLTEAETLDNLQVDVSDDGNLVLSSIVDVDLVLQTFGESKDLIDSSIGELPEKVPVYAVASLGTDGEASIIEELKVGNLSIPAKLLGSINPYVDQGLDLLFKNAMNIDLEKIFIQDGNIQLTGEFPVP
ncbi:MAG: hypothetical protein ACYCYM_03640 [Saccharofermentanales bacterium]